MIKSDWSLVKVMSSIPIHSLPQFYLLPAFSRSVCFFFSGLHARSVVSAFVRVVTSGVFDQLCPSFCCFPCGGVYLLYTWLAIYLFIKLVFIWHR